MTVIGHGYDDNVGAPAFRNVIINGGMSVAQRNTSVASITTGGYYTADRWNLGTDGTFGTWTQSVENDAPTGSGLRKSLKMLCTVARASLSANDALVFEQKLEGQNVQHFVKGTSSAKAMTVSFWVKSNVTGLYAVRLRDDTNSRHICATYTISSSGTWEKKTVTFVGDSTGIINNDNASGLVMQFWLVAGSTYAGGTLATSWATINNANCAVGQTNTASAINNYWQITGVQLEAGSVATPFEFEPFETTFRKCQRYYEKSYSYSVVPGTNQSSFPTIVQEVPFITGFTQTDGWGLARILFNVPKRTGPIVTVYNESGTINTATQIIGTTAGTLTNPTIAGNEKGFMFQGGVAAGGSAVKIIYHYTANAEL